MHELVAPLGLAAFAMLRVGSRGSRPTTPVSRLRSAFCSDSLNVRPMAIASPTDFICVVSRSSAWSNFSKVNRGTLVTT